MEKDENFEIGQIYLKIFSGINMKSKDIIGESDCFCLVKITGQEKELKTKVIDDNKNPDWNHEEEINLKIPLD